MGTEELSAKVISDDTELAGKPVRGRSRRVGEFCGMAIACAAAGSMIGAVDGASTVASTVLYRDTVYAGIGITQVMWSWAVMAAGVGAIAGGVVGVPLYYLVFGRRLSVTDFFKVATISLIGGVVVCLAIGEFAIELSWLATPTIAVAASFMLSGQRAITQTNGGRA